jgi:hypothetical protein
MAVRCRYYADPSPKQRVKLWLKFFLAIVLAFGLAVNHGPGILLSDILPNEPPGRSQRQALRARDHDMSDRRSPLRKRRLQKSDINDGFGAKDFTNLKEAGTNNSADSSG